MSDSYVKYDQEFVDKIYQQNLELQSYGIKANNEIERLKQEISSKQLQLDSLQSLVSRESLSRESYFDDGSTKLIEILKSSVLQLAAKKLELEKELEEKEHRLDYQAHCNLTMQVEKDQGMRVAQENLARNSTDLHLYSEFVRHVMESTTSEGTANVIAHFKSLSNEKSDVK